MFKISDLLGNQHPGLREVPHDLLQEGREPAGGRPARPAAGQGLHHLHPRRRGRVLAGHALEVRYAPLGQWM